MDGHPIAEDFIDGATYLLPEDAYSDPFRPPIPGEAGHPFRLIPATLYIKI